MNNAGGEKRPDLYEKNLLNLSPYEPLYYLKFL